MQFLSITEGGERPSYSSKRAAVNSTIMTTAPQIQIFKKTDHQSSPNKKAPASLSKAGGFICNVPKVYFTKSQASLLKAYILTTLPLLSFTNLKGNSD
jgi:hypothetical protein